MSDITRNKNISASMEEVLQMHDAFQTSLQERYGVGVLDTKTRVLAAATLTRAAVALAESRLPQHNGE